MSNKIITCDNERTIGFMICGSQHLILGMRIQITRLKKWKT